MVIWQSLERKDGKTYQITILRQLTVFNGPWSSKLIQAASKPVHQSSLESSCKKGRIAFTALSAVVANVRTITMILVVEEERETNHHLQELKLPYCSRLENYCWLEGCWLKNYRCWLEASNWSRLDNYCCQEGCCWLKNHHCSLEACC